MLQRSRNIGLFPFQCKLGVFPSHIMEKWQLSSKRKEYLSSSPGGNSIIAKCDDTLFMQFLDHLSKPIRLELGVDESIQCIIFDVCYSLFVPNKRLQKFTKIPSFFMNLYPMYIIQQMPELDFKTYL